MSWCLKGFNAALVALIDPPMQPLRLDICVFMFVWVSLWLMAECVYAIVCFIVSSHGISGCFHLSLLISAKG